VSEGANQSSALSRGEENEGGRHMRAEPTNKMGSEGGGRWKSEYVTSVRWAIGGLLYVGLRVLKQRFLGYLVQ